LQSQGAVDNVFFMCSILHNMILAADGLDSRWEQNVEWDMLNPQSGISDDGYDKMKKMLFEKLDNRSIAFWRG
jgi:hypothetical protein